jgi:hypothetical protein
MFVIGEKIYSHPVYSISILSSSLLMVSSTKENHVAEYQYVIIYILQKFTTRQHSGRYRGYKYRGHTTTYQYRHMTKRAAEAW